MDLIYQCIKDDGIEFRGLIFPFLIDGVGRFLVGNDEFEFEHGLDGGEDLQKYGKRPVLVLIVIGLAFLPGAKFGTVVLDEAGDLLAEREGNIDVEVGERFPSFGRDGIEGIVYSRDLADESVAEDLPDEDDAIHIVDPIIRGRTDIEERPLGEGTLHLVEDEQED